MRLKQALPPQVQQETAHGEHHGALEVMLPAELPMEILAASAMEADDTAAAAAVAQERAAHPGSATNSNPGSEPAEQHVVPAAGGMAEHMLVE